MMSLSQAQCRRRSTTERPIDPMIHRPFQSDGAVVLYLRSSGGDGGVAQMR